MKTILGQRPKNHEVYEIDPVGDYGQFCLVSPHRRLSQTGYRRKILTTCTQTSRRFLCST